MADVAREAINEGVRENAALTEPRPHPHAPPARGGALALLALAALGIVFGDIGTSPLYALRETFHGPRAIAPTPDNVVGVLSLVFWLLIIIVTIKYILFVLQADNRGEGGILALTALATPIRRLSESERWWLVALGVFGAALLYGDGVITPAISVLSAVEGLEIATPLFAPYVIPITLVILVGLFVIQSRGTARLGTLFGPVMLLWFSSLALLGLAQIVQNPTVLRAINPLYGVRFFADNGLVGFLVLGSVFLVVTGAEALYADMGHFGRLPIRLAWFCAVLPALMMNYFGQGALLLANPAASENPFYLLAPSWALVPLVVLATMATVIASQALISGAFSITLQAMELGFLPHLRVKHTSPDHFGQIYIPAVNWLLMIACLVTVTAFRTSSDLAAAYGIAVTLTMTITTLIFYIVAHERWGWSRLRVALIVGPFLIVEGASLAANLVKIPDGGWFPLVLAVVLFILMTTWKRGRSLVAGRLASEERPIAGLVAELAAREPTRRLTRTPGTAIFLSSDPGGAPTALLASIEHTGALHESVLLMTVQTDPAPRVAEAERVKVEPLGEGLYRVTVCYGFMESPDIDKLIEQLEIPGVELNPNTVTFFVNRTRVIPTDLPGMAPWRERLFALMARNAMSVADDVRLPPNQVVEIGTSVEV